MKKTLRLLLCLTGFALAGLETVSGRIAGKLQTFQHLRQRRRETRPDGGT